MSPDFVSNQSVKPNSHRIAVLLTNNDQSEFSNRFPNDGEKVCALLRSQRPDWAYEIYSVKDDVFPDVTAADGYIITGSPASVHDPLPWIAKLEALIRAVDRRQRPIVGLCFGHQVIATALGGRVNRNPAGWRFGVATTHFPALASRVQPGVRQLRLHACHSEQVTMLPPEAELLGGDAFCPNASFSKGTHIITTQYHPEFTYDFMVSLADAYQDEVPHHVLDAGRRELQGPVDADLFAQWATRFFEGTLVDALPDATRSSTVTV